MNEQNLDQFELKQRQKKERVKNVLIAFLIVMLLLTFFSNTIMNYSLPEVSAVYAESATVTSKVRGTGVVEAENDYEVKAEEDCKIASVKVKVGDEVEEGQLLFETESKNSGDEEAIKTAKDELDSMELDYNKALLAAAPSYALDNLEIKSAREDLDAAIAAQSRAEKGPALRQQETDLTAKADKLQADIDALSSKAETLSGNSLDKYNTKIKAKKKDLADVNASLSNVKNELDGLLGVEEAKEQVKAAQKTLDTLLLTLVDKKKEDQVTTGQASLDLKAAKKKIEEKRAEIAKMEKGDETRDEIVAKNAGIISSISCVAGDTVAEDSSLCNIAVTGNGYFTTFSVTKEQAKLVRKDQKAEVLNIWGADMEVVLDEIKPDLDNPNQNKVLKFRISGSDVVVGQTLNLSVGEKSAPYDVVVPNSAIREDNKGKFVLVVKVKSSPLGNRYVLSKADVEVLASDDTNSAVSGGVFGYEYVVTNATKPLENGMKVRLAEQ